jgi:hypothetical protein
MDIVGRPLLRDAEETSATAFEVRKLDVIPVPVDDRGVQTLHAADSGVIENALAVVQGRGSDVGRPVLEVFVELVPRPSDL